MPPPRRRGPKACRRDQPEALDAIRIVNRQAQRDGTAERVADDRGALELQGVEEHGEEVRVEVKKLVLI